MRSSLALRSWRARRRFIRNRFVILCRSEISESTSPLSRITQSATGNEGSTPMSLGPTCNCTLCSIEERLLRDLTFTESNAFYELLSVSYDLRQFPSVSSLLAYLRTSPAAATSDELIRELFAARASSATFVESVLLLVFLPMLHGTIRRVAKQQPALLAEDISQQALVILMQYLRSDELRTRQSHFAFAISRVVKRQVFEWANREGVRDRTVRRTAEILADLMVDERFERHTLLRHFLDRCATKGLISNPELDLIQFKLEGTTTNELCESNGTSSNALRQRLKRLLAKLRRMAHRSHAKRRSGPSQPR
jgi:RNA polymerase sigma factor (sigma-70 family)